MRCKPEYESSMDRHECSKAGSALGLLHLYALLLDLVLGMWDVEVGMIGSDPNFWRNQEFRTCICQDGCLPLDVTRCA